MKRGLKEREMEMEKEREERERQRQKELEEEQKRQKQSEKQIDEHQEKEMEREKDKETKKTRSRRFGGGDNEHEKNFEWESQKSMNRFDEFDDFEDLTKKDSYGDILRRHVKPSETKSLTSPKESPSISKSGSYEDFSSEKSMLKEQPKSTALTPTNMASPLRDPFAEDDNYSSFSSADIEEARAKSDSVLSIPSNMINNVLSAASNSYVITNVLSAASSMIAKVNEKPEDDYEKIEPFRFRQGSQLQNNEISLEICPEKGLLHQGFKCFDCHRSIGVGIFGEARLCDYTGHYYCFECHLNDLSLIPARMVLNWDFRKYKVCRKSKEFLKVASRYPQIPLLKVNPMLEVFLEEIREVAKLRKELIILREYILNCTRLNKDPEAKSRYVKKMGSKEYLMDDRMIDLYSIQAISDTENGQLVLFLRSVHDFFKEHVVKTCEVCKFQGSYCDFCKNKNIIYAFDTDETTRCPNCGALAHKQCFRVEKCPTCLRKKALKN